MTEILGLLSLLTWLDVLLRAAGSGACQHISQHSNIHGARGRDHPRTR